MYRMCYSKPPFISVEAHTATSQQKPVNWLSKCKYVTPVQSAMYTELIVLPKTMANASAAKELFDVSINTSVDKYSNGFVHVWFRFLLTFSMDVLWIRNEANPKKYTFLTKACIVYVQWSHGIECRCCIYRAEVHTKDTFWCSIKCTTGITALLFHHVNVNHIFRAVNSVSAIDSPYWWGSWLVFWQCRKQFNKTNKR